MATRVLIGLSGDLAGNSSFSVNGDGISEIIGSDIPPNVETGWDTFIPIHTAGLQLLYIVSSIACTLFFNGTGTGTSATGELTLIPGRPFLWYEGMGFSLGSVLGTQDISKIYIRNGPNDGTLDLRCQFQSQGNP
jgi:hypothetical protein